MTLNRRRRELLDENLAVSSGSYWNRLVGALLAGLQELAASWIANDRRRRGSYFTRRIAKTAFYASIFGMSIFQATTWAVSKIFSLFAPSLGMEIAQLVRATVRVTVAHYIKLSWISTIACAILARIFLPPGWWPMCFGFGGFLVRVVSDARTKKLRINARRKKRLRELSPEYVENRGTEKLAESVAGSSRRPAHGEGELFGTGEERPDVVRLSGKEKGEENRPSDSG
ncbi:hypothetical protein SAPIO_CDS4419 [Scedosporium apiospermum]|uniref:Uncharacterized protein n=1 Tax=Pseudallescheria apiosperma TaxID=563466 RepID=A0A084G856_PSEDA|nr:uncharacterized protein SAPIO_CDS4419 [Scedosporium apiospermum]KEZ43518.1 hypothetical protein SAPIO_CDS4419 [Scedosporium apiospermum]